MASKVTATIPDCNPKRVVLRLRVSDFEGRSSSEYDDAIKSYLLFAGRPASEDEVQRHYAHIEPFQAPELQQTSFHIIIDIEKHSVVDGEFRGLPHEIYRVRRLQGTWKVEPFHNRVEAANFLSKMRKFTDTYPWAR